jgi:hypothetical protein
VDRRALLHQNMSCEWARPALLAARAPLSARGLRRAGCGARIHRDVNGSANICSRAIYGRYSKIQAATVKYLRPIGVAPLTRATSS